ncbi:tyrosine--tRNA ligase [Mycoplasmopsis agassizii]|uniref:Tyrosine--tRNA ligase n=1 Tax=Mycoplasmopsis agassizii TaxID=33922 RepID=A0A269TJQ5_9BACT|nr:tyrosine--tRNA ligase [Mycoplasmopsis agassizii]PAK21709.1 tyrosine--tRNA ligase [Mycoplasmopsis agassizii]
MKDLKSLIVDLEKRGVIKNISKKDKINLITKEQGAYIGFDPTATSLHLGNYTQIVNLIRIKNAGFKAVALLGGATGMIGDPSFKNSERNLLDMETLKLNKSKIREQLASFGLEVMDNYDFYQDMNVLDFLRIVGKHFNIATLLAKESISSRIEKGLSYTEFSYSLLQAYDFLVLAQNHGIMIQLGGSDQWGNITAGLELINSVHGNKYPYLGITTNLIVDEHGNKFSKSTGGGALWLDKELTSPYTIYQYLFNQGESIIENLLKQLCLEDLSEIEKVLEEHQKAPKMRLAQTFLANSVTKNLHGEEAVKQAIKISEALFNGSENDLTLDDLKQLLTSLPVIKYEQDLAEMLIKGEVVKSKRELKEFLDSNALKVNGEVIKTVDQKLNLDLYEGKYLLIKRGKRHHFIAKIGS